MLFNHNHTESLQGLSSSPPSFPSLAPTPRSAHFALQGTEADLPLQTVCHHHSLLFIKFMIIEGAILVHLTQLDLVKAQRDMVVLLDLCATYPTLLGQPLHFSISMLTGEPSLCVTGLYLGELRAGGGAEEGGDSLAICYVQCPSHLYP